MSYLPVAEPAEVISSTEGKIELPETTPNKASTWTASAVCLSEKKGFGMSSTSLTAILHPLTMVFSPERKSRWHLRFKYKVYNNVVGCLRGEALSVFLSLSPEDILDYQSVKKTLLRRFGCDKNGFKSKFFSAKPSQDEDFATYINRVARYFNRWLELAQVSDFDSLSFLILSEIALQPCDAEFVAYIKDHSPTSLSDLKTQATSYLDARPSKSFIKDSTTSFAGESVRPTARSDFRRPSIHSYRSQTHIHANTPSLGRHTSHTSSGHRPPTHGVHSFDKSNRPFRTSKDNPRSASHQKNSKDAKFNRDGRLHIESASLFGSKCSLLRDTGCNTVGVRRSLVPVSSITGRSIKVNTFCCKNRAFDTAVIYISSPYFSGRLEACLLTNPVADVILGDIDGIIHPTPSNSYSGVDGPVPSACVVTRAQARKTIDNNSQNNMVPSYDPSAQSQLIHTPLSCVPLADVGLRQKVDPTLKDWFNRVGAPPVGASKRGYVGISPVNNTIKDLLSSDSILIIPDINEQFVVRSDASDTGLGAVLLQERNQHLMPCRYASRRLSPRECNYSVIEHECLAIIFAVRQFSKFLAFRTFVLQTDHKPLSFLKAGAPKNSRLMRWALSLQEYSFHIVPIPGNKNFQVITRGIGKNNEPRGYKFFRECTCTWKPYKESWVASVRVFRNAVKFKAKAEVLSGTCTRMPWGRRDIENNSYVGMFHEVTRSVIIKYRGVEMSYTYATYLCPGDGKPLSEEVELPLPKGKEMVRGSAHGEVQVIGDIMGAALNNLQYLVRMPTGCGEQNMIGFVSSIIVLNYLYSTGNLQETTRQAALNKMEIDYQHALNYYHSDGSFSAFGDKDANGSVWLTSFIVKSFAQAQKHIYIDENVIERSVDFLVQSQLETGCEALIISNGVSGERTDMEETVSQGRHQQQEHRRQERINRDSSYRNNSNKNTSNRISSDRNSSNTVAWWLARKLDILTTAFKIPFRNIRIFQIDLWHT
ncbi:alpha-2-macroglobulin-like protein [Plakobranchus ocellatus]|uniref:Alpha-2-macroglobulin-like protein n=1 Tax=Plakobranchus ocellatus TaxID=259542 RepID=A0AAV4BBL8_9GAST|nr:alpha-2-macroglobulin-like protein [Plakobranchus ocellatus]